jgi:nitroreductase
MKKGIALILGRRSIRKFTSKPVSERDVTEMLRAGFAAPSAANYQPWHFIVVTDRAVLDAVPAFHPHAGMLKQAPLGLLVCGEPARAMAEGYWVLDCSAATENILLAAHALGLGGVWLGIYPREERIEGMRELLGLPEGVVPLAMLAIGHPAEKLEPAGRWDGGKIHLNRW